MTKQTSKLDGRTIDITPLFQRAGIQTGTLQIVETDGMYPYKEKIVDNWAYFTAVGMKRLKAMMDEEGVVPTDIGIVGICSGVESIAVAYLFHEAMRRLLVTDVDAEILKGTFANMQATTSNFEYELIPLVGSFCEPIEEEGYTVDLVHANIPNLPATGEEDLTKGAEKGTFLLSTLYEGYNPPEKYISWALGPQYAYLESAKRVLNQGGTVITELGGRVPIQIVQDLFAELGLEYQEVVTGFKEQTEALIDFLGYHRMEREYGTSFEFYLFKESIELLNNRDLANPTHILSAAEYKEVLKPYMISAGEALEFHKKGIAVGHTVHLFRGLKKQ